MHFVNFGIYAALAGIAVRLVFVQVVQHPEFKKDAEAQYRKIYPAKAARGSIYDRNGMSLALNKSRNDLSIHKGYTRDAAKTGANLATLLQISQERVMRKLRGPSPYVVVARGIGDDEAKIIEKTKLPGVAITQSSERLYPFPSLSQVIGFTHADGKGGAGIELEFDRHLKGTDGWRILQQDAHGRSIMPILSLAKPTVAGTNIVLTVDHIMQAIVEEELTAAVNKYNAKGGNVIITDPTTGEILALASSSGQEAELQNKSDAAAWRVRGIADMFEPGSTFKIVTLMAALSEGKSLSDEIFCENGRFKIFGETINDSQEHGNLTLRDVFIHSSNIATAKLALECGKSKLYKAARNFGFGIKTGIELPGETAGILKKPADWSRFTLAAMSYGHEVTATSLQMAMAYGAVANGGLLMRPSIVKKVTRPGGQVVQEFKPEIIRRIMPHAIASQMTDILQGVIQSGTGTEAQIPGAAIAGKTGTAQKPTPSGKGYSNSHFVASFAGFYPTRAPKYLIYVMLDEPYPVHSGGMVAAPTFKRILERVLKIYERTYEPTPPTLAANIQTEKIDRVSTIPQLTGRNVDTAARILSAKNLTYRFRGAGNIVAQQTLDAEKSTVVLNLTSLALNSDYATMPNVVGFSVRRAVAALSLRGINAKVIGGGQVVGQAPEQDSKIRVRAQALLECKPPVSIASLVH